MKTVNIKGKEYVPVNERILEFWKRFPDWALTTEIVSVENKVCIMRAIVLDETGRIRSTGTAYEMEGSSFINKLSYIENCETSAVGRCLGNLGVGCDGSVASAEEVQNAIVQDAIPIVKVGTGTPPCKMFEGTTERKPVEKWPKDKLNKLAKQCGNDPALVAVLTALKKDSSLIGHVPDRIEHYLKTKQRTELLELFYSIKSLMDLPGKNGTIGEGLKNFMGGDLIPEKVESMIDALTKKIGE